jgi:predicted nucleotidyltransferase
MMPKRYPKTLIMAKDQKASLYLPKSLQNVLAEIVTKAQPQSIILFGSRAQGAHRENSDFDLAVLGRTCTDAEWTRLWLDLTEGPWTLFSIDLVEFEKLDPKYQAQILNEGKKLYDR